MKNILLTSCLVLSVLQPAFADEKLEEIEGLVNLDPNLKLEVVSETSRGNRSKSKYVSTFGLGIIDFAGGYRFDVGRFMDTNSVLGIRFSKGSISYESNSSSYVNNNYNNVRRNDEADITKISVYGKKFFGNSFYVDTQLGYRKIDNESVVTDDGVARNTVRGSEQALVASFSIGNQWHWEDFTLGTDWVGLNAKVADLSGFESDETNPYYDYSNIANEKVNLNLLNFYIGMTF